MRFVFGFDGHGFGRPMRGTPKMMTDRFEVG